MMEVCDGCDGQKKEESQRRAAGYASSKSNLFDDMDEGRQSEIRDWRWAARSKGLAGGGRGGENANSEGCRVHEP